MTKFWRRLSWGYVEFSHGVDIDQDGDTDGTGWLFRIELPGWLVRFAQGRLPKRTEDEWVTFREDISDVLLASLMIRPMLGMIPTVTKGDYTSHVTRGEDE